MNHPDLKQIPLPEQSERVPGVGSALLQLLAIQQELGEPLNLNGDLLGDLLDDRVVHCPNDGEEGLEAMFAVTAGASEVAGRMLRFRDQHAMYDDEYRPSTYHRLGRYRSRRPATDAIRVIFKRKADEEVEGQRPAKRAVGGKESTRKATDPAKNLRAFMNDHVASVSPEYYVPGVKNTGSACRAVSGKWADIEAPVNVVVTLRKRHNTPRVPSGTSGAQSNIFVTARLRSQELANHRGSLLGSSSKPTDKRGSVLREGLQSPSHDTESWTTLIVGARRETVLDCQI
ncbi:hypothetical protein C8R47DRAFT_1302539 [Mycena vitilis]|nr:hypothetical protein C8R47DRAFT_1302539 [Mycena vitilis]